MDSDWDTLPDSNSDHFPILIHWNINFNIRKLHRRRWNFKKADWKAFSESLDELIVKNHFKREVEEDNNILVKVMHKAAKKTISIPFWEEANLSELFKERHDTRQIIVEDPYEANRKAWNTITEKVQQGIAACKLRQWEKSCQKLSPHNGGGDVKRMLENIENRQQKQSYETLTNILRTAKKT